MFFGMTISAWYQEVCSRLRAAAIIPKNQATPYRNKAGIQVPGGLRQDSYKGRANKSSGISDRIDQGNTGCSTDPGKKNCGKGSERSERTVDPNLCHVQGKAHGYLSHHAPPGLLILVSVH